MSIIWVNGKFTEREDSKIDILTHTLHYGTGAFEGIRSYEGKIFKAQEHYERLRFSGDKINIDIEYSTQELIEVTKTLLNLNNLKNAYIRPLIYKGSESTRLKAKCSNHIMISCWALENYFDEVKFNQGISITFSQYRKISARHAPIGTKISGLYVLNLLAGQNIGYFDDAVMLDEDGFVAECTTSNIFLVKNNVLITPSTGCFLNGITRQTIIEIAKSNNITVIEKQITPDELLEVDGIFITGTAVEIVPVTRIENTRFAIPGLTRHLMTLYKKLVTQNSCLLHQK